MYQLVNINPKYLVMEEVTVPIWGIVAGVFVFFLILIVYRSVRKVPRATEADKEEARKGIKLNRTDES